jgi:hypothetical protein
MTRRSAAAILVALAFPISAGCRQILGIDVLQDPEGEAGAEDATSEAPAEETGAYDATMDQGTDAEAGGYDAPIGEGGADSAADGAADAHDAEVPDAGCDANTVRSCGTCGNDCTALPNLADAGVSCIAGKCSYQCAPGYGDCLDAGKGCYPTCDGGCVDTTSDWSNCGSCGHQCGTWQSCFHGVCVPCGGTGGSCCPTGTACNFGGCCDSNDNQCYANTS